MATRRNDEGNAGVDTRNHLGPGDLSCRCRGPQLELLLPRSNPLLQPDRPVPGRGRVALSGMILLRSSQTIRFKLASYSDFCVSRAAGTSTDQKRPESPRSSRTNPVACPYSQRARRTIHNRGKEPGSFAKALATVLLTGSTTAIQTPNATK